MAIKRTLQNARWEWNDSSKELKLCMADTELVLNKIYMFSLMRFCIRVSQRLARARRIKEGQDNES